MNLRLFQQILFFFSGIGFSCAPLFALDHLEFTEKGQTRKEEGRIVLEAETGLAFECRDGQYFILKPEVVIERRSDDRPFHYFTKAEVLKRLKSEFPESRGFRILDREPFLIVHTTSRSFAEWYGQLMEKLYTGYFNFWKRFGIPLEKPTSPLVVLLFSNQAAFTQYGLGDGFQPIPGRCAYYNKATNRVVICDLSGLETFREDDRGRASSRDIQTFLEQPNAANNIATVIHEATHLVGFSCGMHQRFAPYPLWLCEGLAVFHEVPDRGKRAGWTITPKTNDYRLRALKRYLAARPVDPIQAILREDAPFNVPASAENSYAMAWGLTYYLVKKRPAEFSAYLKKLAEKTILSDDTPEIRMRDFEDCFGGDWQKLYKDCGAYLLK